MTARGAPPVLRQITEDVVLVELPGLRVLVEAACPHRKGRLRFGYVNGRTGRITCPLHHSSFDLRTGRPMSGPACRPLRVAVLPADASDLTGPDQPGTGQPASGVTR